MLFNTGAVHEGEERASSVPRKTEQTRTVVLSSFQVFFFFFASATTFFPKGLTLVQAKIKREQMKRKKWPTQCLTSRCNLLTQASLTVVRRRSVPLLPPPHFKVLSLRCVRGASSFRSLRPCTLQEWHYPNSVIIRCKENSSAWLTRTMRDGQIFTPSPPLPSVPPLLTRPHLDNLTVRATQPCKHNSYVCAHRAMKQTYRLHYPCSYY